MVVIYLIYTKLVKLIFISSMIIKVIFILKKYNTDKPNKL